MLLRGLSRATAQPASRQSTVIALALAIAVAIAGALVWGLVAMLFKVQLSLIGLLLGAGVGAVVARYRAGNLPTIIAGAVVAVAGCALGTLLGIVFQAMNAHVPLSFILGHLSGPNGLLHYFPGAVGGFGVLFWALAAFAAIRIPLQSQRVAASRTAMQAPGGLNAAGPGPGAQGSYGQPDAQPAAPPVQLAPFFGTSPAGGEPTHQGHHPDHGGPANSAPQ